MDTQRPQPNGRATPEPSGQEGRGKSEKSNRAKAAARDYQPEHKESKRRPAEEREHAFNTLAWLVEGATGLYEELRHSDLGLSEEFWLHAYAARRETLLAARALIDELLEDDSAQKAKESRTRQERRGGIDIEF